MAKRAPTSRPSPALHWSGFASRIGRCGIAWSNRGVVALALPAKSDTMLRRALVGDAPVTNESPPKRVGEVVDRICALLDGDPVSVAGLELDLSRCSPDARRTYEAVQAIPIGETRPLAAIAKALGMTPRLVRTHLQRNPIQLAIPSHRVLDSDGRPVGDAAPQVRILAIESAHGPTYFDGDGMLGYDPKHALETLRATDPTLGRLIERIGPYRMTLHRTPSIFVALAEAIVYQQLSGRAAATIWSRVRALFPMGHTGPTPEQLHRASDTALRGAGLSQNKLLALRDLAKHALDGTIPTLVEAQSMTDDALIDALTQVRGIGRWTVEMLLMFRLGRPDLLPVDDLGVRKGYAVAFRKREMPTAKALAEIGKRWSPYRTVAAWYFWRATEL